MTRFLMGLLTATALMGGCNSAPTSTDTAIGTASALSKNYPISLQKIAEGVWVHTSNYTVPGRPPIPSNGLIVADGDELIVVDTAWGEKATESLLEKVKTEIGKPVTKLIITHHNLDKLAGVDVMEFAGVEVFTHPLTPIKSVQAGHPVPNTSVAALKEARSRTKVGSVEIAYPGVAHSEENLVVYIPSQKILYGGYAVKGAEVTSIGNVAEANLKAWSASLNWVKATYPETQIVVPASGKGAGLNLINKTLAMIATKVNADTKAAESSKREAPAKP